ncbi:hypothetical protein ACFY8X_38885 [Streptomyces tanashiensis]|uniref:hypothetical protein n=1 Tax=Streptomyces tanashiensis TaxID=67367 RepID=UPI0036F0E6AB
MSSGDTLNPAERLRLLQDEYLVPSAGHRAERVSRSTEPGTPIRLAVYDHMRKSVGEVVALATSMCDDQAPFTPPPAKAADVYQWLVEETDHLNALRQQARDAVIYRQGLEHAIVMGDLLAIRPHPCPSCATWGLVWNRERETVVCLNRRCADDDGQLTTWTLAQIAENHVARRNGRAARAT